MTTDSTIELMREGIDQVGRKDYVAALHAFKEAQKKAIVKGDLRQIGESWNNLGVVYRLQKKWTPAAHAFDQAEAAFKEINDLWGAGQMWGNRGDLFARQGRREEAIAAYSESSSLLAESNHPDAKTYQSRVLYTYSLLRLRQAHWIEAIHLMNQSLALKPNRTLFDWFLKWLTSFAMALFKGTQ